MMSNPLINQATQTIAQLFRRREELDVRASRMINELSWRLFPTGGALCIDVPPAEQAFRDLLDALREARAIQKKIDEFPDLIKQEVA